MLRKIPICCALAAWFCLAAGLSRAEVEWTKRQTLQTDSPPVAMTVSADGKYSFVLTEAGKVLVYSFPATLEGSIDVGKDVRSISVSADGSTLFLADAKGSAIQVLTIEFIQKINIAGAPFKGPADAPVAVVLFSDFQ